MGTAASAGQGLGEILLGSDDRDRTMQNRIQTIGVWRPLVSNPITEQPSEISDYQSVNDDNHPYPSTDAEALETQVVFDSYFRLLESNLIFLQSFFSHGRSRLLFVLESLQIPTLNKNLSSSLWFFFVHW